MLAMVKLQRNFAHITSKQNSFRLLYLPAELRLIVFDTVFQDHAGATHGDGVRDGFKFPPKAILRCSKQIYAKSLRRLYRNYEVKLCHWCSSRAFKVDVIDHEILDYFWNMVADGSCVLDNLQDSANEDPIKLCAKCFSLRCPRHCVLPYFSENGWLLG